MTPRSAHPRRRPTIAALLLALPLLAATATVAPASEFTIVTQGGDSEHSTNLHVVGHAERLVPRDLARVELRIEITGGDPKALETELNQRVAAALDRAKKLPGLKIETGAFAILHQVPPAYPRAIQSMPMQPTGDGNAALLATAGEWKASQLLSLASQDLRGLVGLLTDLQKDGAVVSEMRFEVAPDTLAAVRKELTAEAIANLRAAAEQTAGAMGMRIERYRSLDIATPNLEMAQMRQPFPQPGVNAGNIVLQASDVTVGMTANANVSLAPSTTP